MKTTKIDIIQAIEDPELFRPFFKSLDSWKAWFVFLKALFNLPMTNDDKQIFSTLTGGSANSFERPFNEAWLVCGRRSGKSLITALIAVFLACFKDYKPYLAKGERGVIMVLASDRKQSRVLFNYIRSFITQTPLLSSMVEKETAEGIELTNGVVIEIQTASFRAVRGYTIVAALLDEVAFWRSENSLNPDKEILASLRPAMATIPNSLLIGLSSPYARRGVLWEAYKNHYGKDSPVLIWQAPSLTMNSTLSRKVIEEAYEQDPITASAEFGAEFRKDIETFINQEVLESCVIEGRHELPFVSGIVYHAFCDPSGGSQDSFTIAIGHHEKGIAVVDAVREKKPPFSPEIITKEFCEFLKSYHISKVIGDRYGGEWPREQFRKYGILYEVSERPKSELYLEALPLLNSGKVELLDNKTLFTQLANLERKTSRNGRDAVDHPPAMKDDLANSVAGVIFEIRKFICPIDLKIFLVSPEKAADLWSKSRDAPCWDDID